MKKYLLILVAFLFTLGAEAQKFDQLARTSSMGWNRLEPRFSLRGLVRLLIMAWPQMQLVSTGMKDAGYEYIVIGRLLAGSRDENGE